MKILFSRFIQPLSMLLLLVLVASCAQKSPANTDNFNSGDKGSIAVSVVALNSTSVTTLSGSSLETTLSMSISPASFEITCTYAGFIPPVLTVSSGTEVSWKNIEHIDQSLTSDNGLFNVYVPMDYTFSYVFSTPGVYNYHDDIHPDIKGTVVVK